MIRRDTPFVVLEYVGAEVAVDNASFEEATQTCKLLNEAVRWYGCRGTPVYVNLQEGNKINFLEKQAMKPPQ